jgi:uncharacterized protein with HEPN domain
VPPRRWKARLHDMNEAIDKIFVYCQGIESETEFSSDTKTFDACVRNLQVLGDAASKIPAAISREIKEVPWKQVKGMRNVLVHEYFGISPSVLWNTIKNDLPALKNAVDTALRHYDHPLHPWRICPRGEVYVRSASVKEHVREGSHVRGHPRREHCRELEPTGKDVLSTQEIQEIAELYFKSLTGPPTDNDLNFGSKGTQYDHLIRGWVKYWGSSWNRVGEFGRFS